MTDCKHGPRKRIVQGGSPEHPLQAGEHCPVNDPGCGVVWVGLREVMACWAASGPPPGGPVLDEPSLTGIVSLDAAAGRPPKPDESELPPAPTRYIPRRYR